jgi:hypothetical protein
MDKKERVLSFFRMDGPMAAKFCFLTIEDGRGFTEEERNNPEKAFSYFEGDEHWMPKEGDLREVLDKSSLRNSLGIPGLVISKLMGFLAYGESGKEYEYASEMLYMQNEMNVKYFPITRSAMAQDIDTLLNYIGFKDVRDYHDLCWFVRPRKFLEKTDIFNAEKFFIVCGLKYEWMEVMKNVFPKTNYFNTERCYSENKKRISHEFYENEKGQATHAYFNMFARGLSDKEIHGFAERILERRPDLALIRR